MKELPLLFRTSACEGHETTTASDSATLASRNEKKHHNGFIFNRGTIGRSGRAARGHFQTVKRLFVVTAEGSTTISQLHNRVVLKESARDSIVACSARV